MNSFIPCSENCKYQKDGQCHLEDLTYIGNSVRGDCAYFIPNNTLISSNDPPTLRESFNRN